MGIKFSIDQFLRAGAQIGAASYEGALQGEVQAQKQQMQQLQQQHLLAQMADQSERMRLQQEGLGLRQEMLGLQQKNGALGEQNRVRDDARAMGTQMRLGGNTEGAAEWDARSMGGTGQRAALNPAEQGQVMQQQWQQHPTLPITALAAPENRAPESIPGRYPFPGQNGAPGGEITAQPDLRKPAAAGLTALQRVLAKGATAIWKDPAKKQAWDTFVQQVTPAMAHPITTTAELQALQALIPYGEGLLTSSQPAVAAAEETARAHKANEDEQKRKDAAAAKKQTALEKHQAEVEARTLKHEREVELRENKSFALRLAEFEYKKKHDKEIEAKTKKAKVFDDADTQRLHTLDAGMTREFGAFSSLYSQHREEWGSDWSPLYPDPDNQDQVRASDHYISYRTLRNQKDAIMAAAGKPIYRPKEAEPKTPPTTSPTKEHIKQPNLYGIFPRPDKTIVHPGKPIPRRQIPSGGGVRVAPLQVPVPPKAGVRTPAKAAKPNRWHSMSDDELIKQFTHR